MLKKAVMSAKGGKSGKEAVPTEPKKEKQTPIDVIDSTPFPVPDLYFKVYESEEDEPESKIRRDVNKVR